jgi:hypothetical protein
VSLYRKKPVVIEARQLAITDERENLDALAAWCDGAVRFTYRNGEPVPHIIIRTLEGDHRADAGDWIIKGVKGEFYPCKPDIFEQTYEPAGGTT